MLSQIPTIQDPTGSGWTVSALLATFLGWLLFYYLPRQETRADEKDKAWVLRLEKKDMDHQLNIKEVQDHCLNELKAITNGFLTEIRVILKSCPNQPKDKP